MQTIIKDDLDIENFMINDYFKKYDEIIYINNVILIDKDINLKLIQKFIERNIDIHQKDEQLLIINCSIGDFNVVKLLIKNGANIHAQNDNAFIISCLYGYIEIVNLLIEHGANIHAQNSDALIKSCEYEHIDIVKLLLKLGANIHAQDDKAFIDCCIYNNINMFNVLINIETMKYIPIHNNNICLICKRNNEKLIQLNCSHVYHIECLINCFKRCKKIVCPYCQTKIDWSNCYTN